MAKPLAKSSDTKAAIEGLRVVLSISLGNTQSGDEIAHWIDILIESKLADMLETIANKTEEKLGVRI